MRNIVQLFLILFINVCNAGDYQVCFTPGQDCTALIVDTISRAHQSIFVQAYSFTSAPIAKALVDAKNRNVHVEVLLDKSQSKKNKYTSATFLINNHVSTWIDYKPSIAHNKVLIIDKKIVLTGSFNFTKAAQYKNAENVLIITSTNLAQSYLNNWYKRREQSKIAN